MKIILEGEGKNSQCFPVEFWNDYNRVGMTVDSKAYRFNLDEFVTLLNIFKDLKKGVNKE